MKVAWRIVIGSALLIALLVGAMAYQISVLRDLALGQRRIAEIEFATATVLLEQSRRVDELKEFLRKGAAVAESSSYEQRARRVAARLRAAIAGLRPEQLPEPVAASVAAVEDSWGQVERLLQAREVTLVRVEGTEPDTLGGALDRLRANIDTALVAVQAAIGAETERGTASRRAARRNAWTILLVALVLAGVFTVLTTRSIQRPLARLVSATRAVAAGDLGHRIELEGNDEFAALAADFDAMVRRLRELDDMKRDFVSHVSHDLKTPLASIQETNELLLQGLIGGLNPRQRRLLELNRQNAQRLSAMISKLLDVARLEQGGLELDLKPRDVHALVLSAMANVEAAARSRRVELLFEPCERRLTVTGDEDRLLQTLDNLLENAIKFSPSGGRVRITTGVHRALPQSAPPRARERLGSRRGTWVEVAVADSGPGIEDDEKPLVFEKFHQARHNAGLAGGVGLGLAICREISHGHGGAIWVEDAEGGGAVFRLLLPEAVAAAVGQGVA